MLRVQLHIGNICETPQTIYLSVEFSSKVNIFISNLSRNTYNCVRSCCAYRICTCYFVLFLRVGPAGIDISSGLEDNPGKKSVKKISDFLSKVKNL